MVHVCVYLGPAAPSESWLPASLGVPADLVVGDVGGGAALGTETIQFKLLKDLFAAR